MVHSFTAPQVSDTVTMCSVSTDANIVPSVPSRPLPTRSPGGVDARPAGDLVVGAQHLADRLAVPELLVRPHREEAGDDRVVVGAGHEQVAQVAHGVVLDVVHVAQAAQRVVGQRLASEVVVVDVGVVEGGNGCDVAVDVEVHGGCSSAETIRFGPTERSASSLPVSHRTRRRGHHRRS